MALDYGANGSTKRTVVERPFNTKQFPLNAGGVPRASSLNRANTFLFNGQIVVRQGAH
jgi:hypothetical protein